MAKRRKKKYVRRRRRAAPARRRRRRSSGMFGMGQEITAVGSGLVYGAVRGKIASFAVPQLQKVPVLSGLMSQYGDEVGMAVGLWAVGKLKPSLKKYTTKALLCEGFSAGKQIMGNW